MKHWISAKPPTSENRSCITVMVFIIMACRQHGFPWLSLAILLYMVSSICIEMMNISFCRLANTCVSMCSSPLKNVAHDFVLTSPRVPNISCLFFFFGWFVWWKISGCTTAVFLGAASRIRSKLHTASLWSSHLAFSPSVLFESKWCSYRVVLTWLPFTIILVLFYRRDCKYNLI